MATEKQDTTHPIVLPVKAGSIGVFIRDANDVMIASTVNSDVAHEMIQTINSHAALVAALHNLWLQTCIHYPNDKHLDIYRDEALDALDQAGFSIGDEEPTP